MENAPKKGMSKGCLIGLIVGLIIAVVAIVLAVTCWIYKDDLAKMGAATLVNGLKTELASHEYENVDTAQFNLMADKFLEKLEAEDPLDLEKYSLFMSGIQTVMADEDFSEDEVVSVMGAFAISYPDLQEYLPVPESDMPMEEDSLLTE